MSLTTQGFRFRESHYGFGFAQASANSSQAGIKNSTLGCLFFVCESSLRSSACMFGRLHIAHQEFIRDFGYYHFVRVIFPQQSPRRTQAPQNTAYTWASRLLEDTCQIGATVSFVICINDFPDYQILGNPRRHIVIPGVESILRRLRVRIAVSVATGHEIHGSVYGCCSYDAVRD